MVFLNDGCMKKKEEKFKTLKKEKKNLKNYQKIK